MLSAVLPLFFHLGLVSVRAQTYSATYLPSNAPNHSEQGQSGTNQCGTGSNQTSQCQNAYINSVDDFCIYAPPEPGPGSVIGNTERIEVSWCIKPGYGTRLIPDGTVTGAHFVQTPDYVQVTGVGDFTKINIPKGDAGGELDPHGADGNGNPIGGLVFSSAFTGQIQQIHEWTNFMSDSQFCFRACKDGPKAPGLCQHIYDVMGCEWNMPGNYGQGFAQCAGDSGEPMGVYGASTFHQGDGRTPPPHPAPPTSSCTTVTTIGNSVSVSGAVPTNSTTSPTAPPTTSGSGSSATRTSSSASSTSSSNAAPAIRFSGSGALVGLVTVVVGAFIF
ncbi:hypothetical protein H4582DRAFT_1403060 [Lactarius indigo]|nr:hypothetical protein H4582DRAFT_1403060 [Lactarius indigo]